MTLETVFTETINPATILTRPTTSNVGAKLSLQFVGGYCAGQPPLWVETPEFTLGRGPECSLVLSGDTLSRVHCRVLRLGSAYLLEDLSRNGTFVNGQRISGLYQLQDGDQVRIGKNYLRASFVPFGKTQQLPPKQTERDLLPLLLELRAKIVVKGLEAGVTQPFSETNIMIGRRSDNHLVLDGDNISRRHVSIERRDEQYFARDLGSANGTFVNGQRVQEAQLKDGDQVRIGKFILNVSLRNQDCILNFKRLQ